jgi:DNA replication factor GINS
MDIIKLREMLEEELSRDELVHIDGSFYTDFDSLVKALRLGAESSKERGEDIEEAIYLEQLRIAEGVMREIIRLRLHKLVDAVFSSNFSPGELIEEERKLFLILKAFVERESSWNLGLPAVEVTAEENEPVEYPSSPDLISQRKKVVREAYIVAIDLPSVIDENMNEYGPIRAGDLVVLPESIGRVLLERGVAQRARILF